MLTKRPNPLLAPDNKDDGVTFDQTKLKTPFSVAGKTPTAREIKKSIRCKTAKEAIGELYPRCSIFGITKGQFSLIELITAILDQTGPADLFVSTWTAASADLTETGQMMESGKIISAKFLVDMSFQRRQPAFAAKIRDLFGTEAIRVTRNHAKFCLISNQTWNIVLNTSMNLNFNPRLEDFFIQDDEKLFNYLFDLVAEIFGRMKSKSLYDTLKRNNRAFKSI